MEFILPNDFRPSVIDPFFKDKVNTQYWIFPRKNSKGKSLVDCSPEEIVSWAKTLCGNDVEVLKDNLQLLSVRSIIVDFVLNFAIQRRNNLFGTPQEQKELTQLVKK